MIQLADVNVLIALIDPWHIYHDHAHEWLKSAADTGWATCPLVENGALRILGSPRYVGGPGSIAAAAALVGPWLTHPYHHFWPDEVSLFDPAHFDTERLGSSARITDAYLLALAALHGGKLATFDRRVSPVGVRSGQEALHIIA